MRTVSSPPYPGVILEAQYLRPHGLSAGALARRIGVPRSRIERLIKAETSMTADTAVRLAAFFRNDPQFWMGLQVACDVYAARLRTDLSGIRPLDAT